MVGLRVAAGTATGLAVDLLSSMGPTTFEGPFGQAHGVPQLSHAPYTAFNNDTAFKTLGGVNRYLADNGAAFAEVVVRALFGWQPRLLWDGDLASAVVAPNLSRGFSGVLANLMTPVGPVNITAGPDGLHVQK